MSDTSENSHSGSTALGVDDAVGVSSDAEKRVWYVAVVNRNSEKLIRERLLQNGYEAYVASQLEEHRWANGRKKKVERAQLLLITEDMLVKEVAAALGILDYSYFTRLFKKTTGKTPQEYRETMK